MSIIRSCHDKNNPYVMLKKTALEDNDLSWAAKGLWAYLMSRPDDWQIRVTHLSKIYDKKGGGERAIYSLLKELIQFGYCEKIQKNSSEKGWCSVEYVITELKKSLPLCSQADARDADARKSDYTKEGVQPNKELQQDVAVYESLKEDKRLPEQAKKILSKYPEDRVKLALEFSKIVKPKTSFLQMLIWHINCDEPPIAGQKNTLLFKCQKAFHEYFSMSHEIEVNEESICFIPLFGQSQPTKIKFNEENAEEKIAKFFKRCKFEKKNTLGEIYKA